MSISEVFIRRPIATALLMVGILVFGMATFTLLPIAALPNVDFPTIVVSASLPGASPQTMASSVATPLEQQFAAIPGLAQMSSTSGLGTTSITLQFDLARNIDGAAEDVQTAINAASGLLPKTLPTPPTFKKTNPADRAILIYAISSNAMPIQDLDQYAYNVIAELLSRVNGVSQVNIAGEQIPAVHVQVNPDALASRGISLEDVRTALINATTDLPKGNLEGKRQEFTLDTNDQLFDASAFRNIIAAYRNGGPDAFGQEQVTTVYTDTAQHKVILEVEPRFQDDPSALSHIYVKSTSGTQVPLSAVTHYSEAVEPQTVNAPPGSQGNARPSTGKAKPAMTTTMSAWHCQSVHAIRPIAEWRHVDVTGHLAAVDYPRGCLADPSTRSLRS